MIIHKLHTTLLNHNKSQKKEIPTQIQTLQNQASFAFTDPRIDGRWRRRELAMPVRWHSASLSSPSALLSRFRDHWLLPRRFIASLAIRRHRYRAFTRFASVILKQIVLAPNRFIAACLRRATVWTYIVCELNRNWQRSKPIIWP